MSKFANLERYIITNNQQEIELTFDKIESLISAYDKAAGFLLKANRYTKKREVPNIQWNTYQLFC